MASVEECEAALGDLAALLAGVDADKRQQHTVDRTLSCWITDLKECFTARLGAEGLTAIQRGGQHDGQVRLKVSSDDLVALTKRELSFPVAWATGRVKVDASIGDLLRLRSLL
ncbi:MAG TPA: alkyl sulfatase [Frankiaceae bacterium]|nr:alkyl sulfatase [Frankiaceae bacterium]